MAKAGKLADLRELAVQGAAVEVRVSPGARRNAVERDAGGAIRVHVTAPPEDGKATEACRKLLARALGVAPSRLRLVRGATSRTKAFALE